MPRHERRNIFFGPRPESARVLWTLALVAGGWVDTDDAAGDGEGHEAAQGPQHVGLRMRPERIEDPRDVARLHHGQPLIAVLGREALEQRAPHPLCGGRELVAELLRIEIGGHNRIHAARVMAIGANQRGRAAERLLVGGHEGRRPGRGWQRHGFVTAAAEVEARVTVAIDECMDVERQFQSRSHSFGSFGASPPTTMLILPSFVMSTRTFSTPAARTARIARVMSDCRNVEGARAMGVNKSAYGRSSRRRFSRSSFITRDHSASRASALGSRYMSPA